MATTVPTSQASSLISTSRGRIITDLVNIPDELRVKPDQRWNEGFGYTPIRDNAGNIVAYRNTRTGNITPVGRDNVGRDPSPPREPIGNNLARPGDGKYTGVNGPATFYDVHVGSGGGGGSNGGLNSALANNNSPNGLLPFSVQQQLVAGSNLLEIEELLPYLDPLSYIQFDTKEVEGITLFYNARLLSSVEVDQLGSDENRKMNFPTAVLYAREGRPIARSGWGGSEGTSTRWLTYESGLWFMNDGETRNLVTSFDADEEGSPNVTASDILSIDWMLPVGCRVDPQPERPDLPSNGAEATAPKFDVHNPPCRV